MDMRGFSSKSALLPVITLALIISACSDDTVTPRNSGEPPELTMVVLADPHLDSEKEESINNLERAVEYTNQLAPDLVMICGDLIANDSDENDASEFNRIKAQIDPSIEIFLTPGNHDLGEKVDEESLEFYRERLAEDKESAIINGYGIISFNTSLIRLSTGLGDQEKSQLNWLISELEAFEEMGIDEVYAMTHFPFFIEGPNEGNSSLNVPFVKRKAYLEVLHEFGVDAVFTGHYHGNLIKSYRDIELITTGPLYRPTRSDLGFRVVKVFPDGLEHKFFKLDDPVEEIREWYGNDL